MKRVPLLLLLLAIAVSAAAQLTIDGIMRGPNLVGYQPQNLRWSPDGKQLYFEWKVNTDAFDKDPDTWVVGRDGKGLRKLSEEEKKDAPPGRNLGAASKDRKRFVYVDNGDVFLWENGKRRNLTSTVANESRARFTKDERGVTFVRDDNLFRLSLDSSALEQLTNIVGTDDKSANVKLWDEKEKKGTASQEYLKAEERKLIGAIDRMARKREEDEAEAKKEHPLKPLKLERKQSLADAWLTGDGKYVIASFRTDAEKSKRANVPEFVTESGYTEELPGREKVGDALPTNKVASISTANGEVKWLEHGLKVPAKQDEKAAEKTEKTETPKETDREVRYDAVVWSDDGMRVVVPVRARDNKDWWLFAFDYTTGKTRVLATEHDDAWVRGPQNDLGFLGDDVYYLSEKTGWMQLYSVPFAGGAPKQLTDGKFEIDDVAVSNDRKWFYLTTSEESPYERHLYKMAVAGGARTKMTAKAGDHAAVVAPDGLSFADVYSYSNRPPEVFIGTTQITTSPAKEFFDYPWLDTPIVQIPARDGKQLPAHLYKPASWQRGGKAVIFVHGAGYLQNIHRGWSSYYREYMFHHFLMEHGYLVIDVDYRASAGYGRDWRTAIYRHMGGVDLDDQIDAAKWLVREQGVDAKRIGIYGGSYGGFITLMALFTQPGVFNAGAALRPVTDWAHYNDPYTANILNRPQDDPEAYRRSSPIYFADGLRDKLLICHGMADVNVHFQDTVLLMQKLIELRKENWSVAPYPIEDHTFVDPASWADEYKRIYKLFEGM
ncbi:MAG: S9 family peptidase [Acidobacteria bacterium]|nr:S9 family peptidase [Acidobacteriota bacterium]